MLYVKVMKPFYSKIEDSRMKLVFAYQYFSILKDEEVFQFIPVEGKEMIINLNTLQIENLSEVFVFQKGNRFIRLPLYQLLLVSDVHEHLQTLLENVKGENGELSIALREETETLIKHLENENYSRMIDYALSNRNEALFYNLTNDAKEII